MKLYVRSSVEFPAAESIDPALAASLLNFVRTKESHTTVRQTM